MGCRLLAGLECGLAYQFKNCMHDQQTTKTMICLTVAVLSEANPIPEKATKTMAHIAGNIMNSTICSSLRLGNIRS
jgi:hypothetical protein